MRILKFPKPSQKTTIAALLILLLVGVGVTLYALQQQQNLRQQASQNAAQTAKVICSPTGSKAVIQVSFKNTRSFDVGVVALDLQSKKTLDMDIIAPNETKTAQIQTDLPTLKKGSVLFTIISVENGTT